MSQKKKHLELSYHLTARADYFILEMTAVGPEYNTQAAITAVKPGDIDLRTF